MEKPSIRQFYPIINLLLLAFAGLATLHILGIPPSALIAFGGLGGIMVGFAAKDFLANVFGGVMIFIDRPFKIGDTIRSPDREIEGTVEYIGLRLTQIRTLTKTKLFVPNSLFSSISLENLSRMTHRRIKTMLYLHPEDAPKLKSLVEEMEELLKRDSRIDFAERGYVRLIASNPIFLKVELHALTKVTHLVEFHLVQQDILLKWLDLFKRHGCRFVSEEQVASYSSSL